LPADNGQSYAKCRSRMQQPARDPTSPAGRLPAIMGWISPETASERSRSRFIRFYSAFKRETLPTGVPGSRDHRPADCKSDFRTPIKAEPVLEQGQSAKYQTKIPDEDPVTIIEQGSGPAPQAVPDLIKETTTQTFVKDVIEESKRQPVLIDFWAPWCGPCRQLTPMLEKAVRAAKGKVKLVKMNIDEHPAIPGQMGIQSIPAVIAFVNGQPADGFMGAVPESQVTAFINKLTAGMPGAGEPNIAEILQEAEAVLAEGDPTTAASIYAEVLAADATNIAALGHANMLLLTGGLIVVASVGKFAGAALGGRLAGWLENVVRSGGRQSGGRGTR